ncbi:hypothetical protein L1987_03914 [Smallanthus sonchifolius]|uniref:Uncharacterized protein n=1 Tax=Smallanthus sonchifolius TaxID=185202 RepID=A0ACB9KBV8_9ASTR|nr:hypothetical protein L1987_03914 [Smallanthus sonchifolius]
MATSWFDHGSDNRLVVDMGIVNTPLDYPRSPLVVTFVPLPVTVLRTILIRHRRIPPSIVLSSRPTLRFASIASGRSLLLSPHRV